MSVIFFYFIARTYVIWNLYIVLKKNIIFKIHPSNFTRNYYVHYYIFVSINSYFLFYAMPPGHHLVAKIACRILIYRLHLVTCSTAVVCFSLITAQSKSFLPIAIILYIVVTPALSSCRHLIIIYSHGRS